MISNSTIPSDHKRKRKEGYLFANSKPSKTDSNKTRLKSCRRLQSALIVEATPSLPPTVIVASTSGLIHMKCDLMYRPTPLPPRQQSLCCFSYGTPSCAAANCPSYQCLLSALTSSHSCIRERCRTTSFSHPSMYVSIGCVASSLSELRMTCRMHGRSGFWCGSVRGV